MALTVAELMARLSLDATPFKRGLDDATKSAASAQTKLQAFGERASKVGSALTSVAVPIAAIGGASLKMAGDFDDAMTKIQGLVGVNAKQVEQWKGQIMEMAPAMGKTSKELAEGLYFITSAGIDSSEAMEVLEASAKASAAGLGDTATVADAVTSAINAYGSENITAAQATDVLMAAVREGKSEPQEMAASLGRVIPVAAQMGVSFDQVAAATATMSLSGLDAAEATTALRGIMSTIMAPTKEAHEALAGMGTSADELRAMIREKGLLATLQFMAQEFNGNSEAAEAVIGNVRALTGFLNLTGQEGEKVAGIFKDVKNSTGDTDKAFAAMAESSGFKLRQAMSELNNAMIELGQAIGPIVIPALRSMAEAATGLVKVFGMLPAPLRTLIVSMGGIAIGGAAVSRGLGSAANLLSTFQTKTDTAAAGAGRFSGAMGKMQTAVKGLMILTVIHSVLDAMSDDMKASEQDVSQLGIGLLELNKTGRMTGEAAKGWGKDVGSVAEHLHSAAKAADDPIFRNMPKIMQGMGTEKTREYVKDLDNLDSTLTQLVQGGNAQAAAALVASLKKEFEAQGWDFAIVETHLKDYKTAVDAGTFSNTMMEDAQSDVNKMLAQVPGVAGQAENAIVNLAVTQREYADASVSLESAEVKWAGALDDLRQSQSGVNTSRAEGKNRAEEMREAEHALAGAGRDVTKAQKELAEAQKELDKLRSPATERELADAGREVEKARIAEKEAALALADAQQEVNDLKAEAIQIDKDIAAAAKGVEAAQLKVRDAQEAVAAIQERISETMKGNTDDISQFAEAVRASFEQALDPLKKFEVNAEITMKSLSETLTGNIKVVEEWSSNLSKLAARGHEDLARRLAQLGPQAAAAVKEAANASEPELAKLTGLFAKQSEFVSNEYAVDMAQSMGDVGYDVVALGKLQGDLADANDDLAKAHDGVTDAQTTLSDLQARAKQINADLETAALGVRSAELDLQEATLAVNDAQAAQNDLLTKGKTITDDIAAAMERVEEAAWGVKDAEEAQHKAQLDYNAAMTGGKKPTDDLGSSLNDLKGKQDAAFEAARTLADKFVDAKVKEAEWMGVTIDDTEKHRLLIEKLQELAGTLAPGSPLRQRIEDYIGKLNAVPKDVTTKITADIKSLPISVAPAVGGKPGMISIPIMPAQHGGFAGPGMPRWVGERGPELFWPEENGMIIPNHALGGGGGNTYVEVNLGGFIGTKEQLVDALHDGLLAKQRNSGSLGFR